MTGFLQAVANVPSFPGNVIVIPATTAVAFSQPTIVELTSAGTISVISWENGTTVTLTGRLDGWRTPFTCRNVLVATTATCLACY